MGWIQAEHHIQTTLVTDETGACCSQTRTALLSVKPHTGAAAGAIAGSGSRPAACPDHCAWIKAVDCTPHCPTYSISVSLLFGTFHIVTAVEHAAAKAFAL